MAEEEQESNAGLVLLEQEAASSAAAGHRSAQAAPKLRAVHHLVRAVTDLWDWVGRLLRLAIPATSLAAELATTGAVPVVPQPGVHRTLVGRFSLTTKAILAVPLTGLSPFASLSAFRGRRQVVVMLVFLLAQVMHVLLALPAPTVHIAARRARHAQLAPILGLRARRLACLVHPAITAQWGPLCACLARLALRPLRDPPLARRVRLVRFLGQVSLHVRVATLGRTQLLVQAFVPIAPLGKFLQQQAQLHALRAPSARLHQPLDSLPVLSAHFRRFPMLGRRVVSMSP